MAEIKWIKLSVNMFDDEKIKLIRTLPDGEKIVMIWVQMMCLAGKINDGGSVYMGQNLAYSDEMLATIFNQPLNVVRSALSALHSFEMIDISDNGVIDILNWEKHQNIDGMERIQLQNRERKRRFDLRKKVKELGYNPNDKSVPTDVEKLEVYVKELSNVTVTSSNAIEEDKNREEEEKKRIETNKDSRNSANAKYADDSPFLKLAILLFERIKTRNPKHKKPNLQSWADDVRKTIELDDRTNDEYLQVLEWSQRDLFWQTNILSPAKLRKQFDTLTLQMQSDLNKRNGFKPTVVPQQTKIHEHVISDADKEAFERLQREGF